MKVVRRDIFDFDVVVCKDEFDALKAISDNGVLSIEEVLHLAISRGVRILEAEKLRKER